MDVDLIRRAAEALSDSDRSRFLDLCEARDPNQLRADAARISDHLDTITIHAGDDPLVDLELGRRIAASLLELIRDVDDLSFEQRRLLAGAVEYFIQPGDTADDYHALLGLEDDARIVRAVCNALGRDDLATF